MITQTSFLGISPKYICEVCHKPLSNPTSMRVGMGPVCRGKHQKGLEDVNKKNLDMSKWGRRLDFQGYGGCESHCLVLVQGNIAVATEAPDNEGTSITNCAEVIASEVCLQYGISPDQLVWIEHYVDLSNTFGDEQDGETFDLVTFDIIKGDDAPISFGRLTKSIFEHPTWKHLGKDKAFEMLGLKEEKAG